MDLSIVIVSFNVRGYLEKALASVIDASKTIDCEIIVVDNNSTDGTCEMISDKFRSATLISSDNNEGFAAACNKGICSSSGEYVLILNPDTIVEPDALTIAHDFMRQHPEAGAAGAHMVNGEGIFLPESKRGFPSPLASFFRITGMGKMFPRSSFFNAYYLGHMPDNKTCKADILTGAFMFIRRAALEKAGLFDTTFFMYGEDIDLSWRIVMAGYTNYYLHQCRIIHFKGKSAGHDDIERISHFYEAMIIFTRKHLKPGYHIPVTACVTMMRVASITAARFRGLVKKLAPVVKKG